MRIEFLILCGPRTPGCGVLAIDYAPPMRAARAAPRSVKRVLTTDEAVAALLGDERGGRS